MIPDDVVLRGTCRTLDPEIHASMPERFKRIVDGVCATYGATSEIDYRQVFPVTMNAAEPTKVAAEAATSVAGQERVVRNRRPLMG